MIYQLTYCFICSFFCFLSHFLTQLTGGIVPADLSSKRKTIPSSRVNKTLFPPQTVEKPESTATDSSSIGARSLISVKAKSEVSIGEEFLESEEFLIKSLLGSFLVCVMCVICVMSVNNGVGKQGTALVPPTANNHWNKFISLKGGNIECILQGDVYSEKGVQLAPELRQAILNGKPPPSVSFEYSPSAISFSDFTHRVGTFEVEYTISASWFDEVKLSRKVIVTTTGSDVNECDCANL